MEKTAEKARTWMSSRNLLPGTAGSRVELSDFETQNDVRRHL